MTDEMLLYARLIQYAPLTTSVRTASQKQERRFREYIICEYIIPETEIPETNSGNGIKHTLKTSGKYLIIENISLELS